MPHRIPSAFRHGEAPGGRRLGALLLLALVPALAVTACSWRRAAWQLGLGSFVTDLRVERVTTRGPYLDATLMGHGLTLEVLAPDQAACRRVFQADAEVDYVERGLAGHYVRDGETCIAAGGDLQLVASRRPRATSLSTTPVPRSQATFSVLHVDEEMLLLRGRFPEASRIRWPGEDDLVVGLPNIPVCRSAIEGGVASIEYRESERRMLSLVGDRGLCPIELVALPPDVVPPEEAPRESEAARAE